MSTLNHIERFLIKDKTITYGADQEWYPTKWQRMSGCGPTCFASILFYHFNEIYNRAYSKQCLINLMEHTWNWITPTIHGVYSAEIFTKKCTQASFPFSVTTFQMPLPIQNNRPPLSMSLYFINKSLSHESPVAFLNLHQGLVPELDDWHWVVIVSLFEEDGNWMIRFIDEGKLKVANFSLWYCTTQKEGALLAFQFKNLENLYSLIQNPPQFKNTTPGITMEGVFE